MASTQQNLFYRAIKDVLTDPYWETSSCTRQQFDACEAAWNRLVEESWDEQAFAILKGLFPHAQTHENRWDWLTAELYFEAYAFALDNRAQAALHYLQFSLNVTNETLDQYNQRLQRFNV